MSERIHNYPASSTNEVLLSELAPVAEGLLNKHMDTEKIWYPHEVVPWSEGRDYTDKSWDPDEYPLPEGVRSALFVNLLTEDNLPYYTSTILRHSPADHPLREWNGQWTAEENRHSTVMRDWINITRAINPWELEDARRVQMRNGQVPEPDNLADLMTYVTMQELATNIAHRNTGTALPKGIGRRIMGLVAGDEARHHAFYRDMSKAAFEVDPSTMVLAATRQVKGFKMPGTGIPNFDQHQVAIAAAGIFDARQHKEKVVEPSLEEWNIWNVEGLTPEAEAARESLAKFVNKTLVRVIRMQENQLEKLPQTT